MSSLTYTIHSDQSLWKLLATATGPKSAPAPSTLPSRAAAKQQVRAKGTQAAKNAVLFSRPTVAWRRCHAARARRPPRAARLPRHHSGALTLVVEARSVSRVQGQSSATAAGTVLCGSWVCDAVPGAASAAGQTLDLCCARRFLTLFSDIRKLQPGMRPCQKK